MTRACNRCRGATELTKLDPISGEDKGASVAVIGMPVLVCSQGHRQFTVAQFATRLLDAVLEKAKASLPAANQQGMLIKHYLCTNCGAELQATPDHQQTLALDVALLELEPFKVDLTMPVYHCGKCGADQIHSRKEMQSHVPTALGHAFQDGKITPG